MEFTYDYERKKVKCERCEEQFDWTVQQQKKSLTAPKTCPACVAFLRSTSGDSTLVCCDCGSQFVWTESEQVFYKKHNYTRPKRCATCRDNRRNGITTQSGSSVDSKPEAVTIVFLKPPGTIKRQAVPRDLEEILKVGKKLLGFGPKQSVKVTLAQGKTKVELTAANLALLTEDINLRFEAV